MVLRYRIELIQVLGFTGFEGLGVIVLFLSSPVPTARGLGFGLRVWVKGVYA